MSQLYNALTTSRVYQKIKIGHILFIVSAFFIFSLSGVAISRTYNYLTASRGANSNFSEKVAFEPGNFISQRIRTGYVGK